MRRKDWMLAISTFMFAAAILLTIVIANRQKLPNANKNGFTRNFLNEFVTSQSVIKLSIAGGRICGTTDKSIYVASDNAKIFYKIDKSLLKIDTLFLNLPVSAEIARGGLLLVDSPWIYFHANNQSKIFTANWNERNIDSIGLSTTIFTKSLQLSPRKAVVRAFDSTYREQIFQIADCSTGQILEQRKLIQNQDQAGFSSDGFFTYNRSSNQIIYVQYYKNKMYALDSNLNLLFESKTIDTIRQNDISIKLIKNGDEGRLAPESARITVNTGGFLTDKYLFIQSGLKADNESVRDFSRNNVIDTYASKNGEYLGSFYIPNYKGQKTYSITINDDILIALYKDGLASYKLKFN